MGNKNYIEEITKKLVNKLEYENESHFNLLLMNFYALLVLTTGERTTLENVHDAWSAWQELIMPNHRSLMPFNELTPEVKGLDQPYADAIVEVAAELRELNTTL